MLGKDRELSDGCPKAEHLENAMESERPVHLYWVNLPDDPSEDWFVLAPQALMARRFFAEYEGFETREAKARLVERNVRLRSLEHPKTPCWAKLSDLEALGFEILSRNSRLRSVRKGAETFVEGYLQLEIVEDHNELGESAGRGRSRIRRQARLN